MFKNNKITKILTPVILFIFFPLFLFILSTDDKKSDAEYRTLTDFKAVKEASVAEKFNSLSSYVDDNFPSRETVNEYKSRFDISLLNTSPNDEVIIGQNNMLFLRDSVSWHTDEVSVNEETLNKIRKNLTRLNDNLKSNGSSLVVLIVPDKVSVYPECLPATISLSDHNTEKITNALEDSDISVLFYLDELISYKESYNLYSLYDTHWTSIASYITTRLLVRELGSDNPPIESLSMYEKEYDGNDLARLISIDSQIPAETDYDFAGYGLNRSMPDLYSWDENGDYLKYHTEGALNKSVFVLRDSFFNSMRPFFSIAFSDCVIRHFDKYKPGEILNEGCDIVVIEVCERSLLRLADIVF